MTISAGTIIPYGGSSAPTGFLLCDGSAVSRTTYSTLFGVIGTTFGSGDGSTTFNVPDLRGRVVAGKDDMGGTAANRLTSTTMSPDGVTLGATGGEQTHTLVTSEMPSHAHRIWSSDGGGSGSNVAGFGSSSISEACGLIPIGGTESYYSTFNAGHAVMESTGGGGAHNNVQPTLILNYIIAIQDVSGTGTVTSVAMTGDGVIFNSTVSGSPITTSGTLAPSLLTQAANTVLAGPTSGAAATPTFRALVGADLPNPSSSTLGGVESYAPVAHQFLTGISTSGVPSSAQPAFSDLSGSVSANQMAYPDYISYTFFGGV
jgi:microcystin-dependent protein